MSNRERFLLLALIFVASASIWLRQAAATPSVPALPLNGVSYTKTNVDLCPASGGVCAHADASGLPKIKVDTHETYVVVVSPSPAAGQSLTYNTGGIWTPGTGGGGGGGMSIGGAIGGSPLANAILFANGSGNLADDANLTWTGSLLTIGNAAEIDNFSGSFFTDTIGLTGHINVPTIGPNGTHQGTLQSVNDTFVYRNTTDTLTNKTLTAPILSGSVTGTYTVAGTPTIGAALAVGTDNSFAVGDTTHRLSDVNTIAMHSGASTMAFTSNVANGSSAVGIALNNATSLSTTGAEWLQVNNAGSEVFSVSKSGFGGTQIGLQTNSVISDKTSMYYSMQSGTGLVMDANSLSGRSWVLGTTGDWSPSSTGVYGSIGAAHALLSVTATKRFSQEQTIAAATTITIDPVSGETVRVTLGSAAITTVNAGSGGAGEHMCTAIIQDATGGRTISGWSSSWVFAGGTYTATSTANKRDILCWSWDTVASKWYEQSRSLNL